MLRKAFTIVELMIVMAVIAILVGIAVPRFKGMQDEANLSRARSELKTIQAAVESYYVNQNPNAYPETTSDVIGDELQSASPQIIAEIVYDPFAAPEVEYDYILSDNEAYYVIFSLGVDGEADISGIQDDGVLSGNEDDDIFVTNGLGWNS